MSRVKNVFFALSIGLLSKTALADGQYEETSQTILSQGAELIQSSAFGPVALLVLGLIGLGLARKRSS